MSTAVSSRVDGDAFREGDVCVETWGELLPDIKVEPPGPNSREMSERLVRVESPSASIITLGEPAVFWERAKGANVEDADGNRYIDLTAAFCVSVVGHSNPRVVAAISHQAERLMHHPGVLNPNRLRLELAERLAEWAPGDLSMTHIASTGAEANEVAMKAARLYTGRQTIVGFHGGFHGKTTSALSASSSSRYRSGYNAFLSGVVHVPYPYSYRCPFKTDGRSSGAACADYLEYVLDLPDSGVDDVAAVILEPILGQGGWVVPPPDFLPRVREITEQRGILLIVDEIITGFGRTGHRFFVDSVDVVPDILVCAKGMASGFPISAAIMRPEIAQAFQPVQHTSTFMGNPMGCAAALASIDEIEERKLIQRSQKIGEHFMARLRELQRNHPLIGEVRGAGMMVAIELVQDLQSREPAASAAQRLAELALKGGVMINNVGGTYKNVVKMSPPLVITQRQLDCAIDILDRCLTDLELEVKQLAN